MGHAVSASVEAREKLAMKRQGMAHFHIGRLQRDGFMPLHPQEEFFDAIDPEDPARDAFDHPTIRSRNPYLGPDAPMATQTEAYTETGTGPDDGHDRPDHGGGGGIRRPGIITPFTSGVARGFGSTAARLGGAMIEGSIHGLGAIAGAGLGALANGAVGGVQRLAGIEPANPLDLVPDEVSPEPLAIEDRPRAKARAKARAEPVSPWYNSGGSSSSSSPSPAMPWGVNVPALAPAVPVHIPVFDISTDTEQEEEEPPAPAAAARPGFRQIAQADVLLAERTAHMSRFLPRKRNGRA